MDPGQVGKKQVDPTPPVPDSGKKSGYTLPILYRLSAILLAVTSRSAITLCLIKKRRIHVSGKIAQGIPGDSV
jgi:hypothetical protein